MKWEDPPLPRAGKPGGRPWYAEAEELRSRPGTWGVLLEVPKGQRARTDSLASQVNRALLIAFRPRGAFEATARVNGETAKTYARYVEKPASP